MVALNGSTKIESQARDTRDTYYKILLFVGWDMIHDGLGAVVDLLRYVKVPSSVLNTYDAMKVV